MAIETRIFEKKTVFGEWEVKKFIGSGSGGKTAVFQIVRAHDDWEENAALKVVNILEEMGKRIKLSEACQKEYEKERDELCRQAEEEIRLMSCLKGNPNIVGYYDFQFVDYQEENVFGTDLLIRMELLKSLPDEHREKIEYSEDEAIKIGKDICRGLSFCHRAGIIHRDIKPANIFVTEWGDYKIGDFGIARMVDAGQKASTKMGTRAYAAPEQFTVNTDKYDKRVDIYSLGLTLYELTNHNRLPFASSGYVRENEIRQRIIGEEMPNPENANPALSAVIKKACAYKAENRYSSVEELEEALKVAELGVKMQEKDSEKAIKDVQKGEEGKTEGYLVLAVTGVLLTVLLALILILIFGSGSKKNKSLVETAAPKETVTVTPVVTTAPGEAGRSTEEYEAIFGKSAYVTACQDTTAVITQAGDLYMWGNNESGQVGCGDINYQNKPVWIMTDVQSVQLSKKQTAAVKTDGTLYLWGTNSKKEKQLKPVPVLENVTKVSLGDVYCGAVCGDKTLHTWGEKIENPELIAENIADICMNSDVGGAVTTDGSLYMWGGNKYAQVGNGSRKPSNTPVKIMEGVRELYVGKKTAAVLTENEELYLWGTNDYGQTGLSVSRKVVEKPEIYARGAVESVALEESYGAAILKSGVLHIWGENKNCRIGKGNSNGIYVQPVSVCSEVDSVVLSERYTVILKENGALYLCGANRNYERINQLERWVNASPGLIAKNIVSAAIGSRHIYAIDKDGKFYEWGEKFFVKE